MFGRRQREKTPEFDKTGKTPVVRASICTGEQVAGFRDDSTGRFHEVMLIRTDGDLREFMRLYGVSESEIQRVW